ncbi:MAG TPA: transcription termination factor NusA [Candidatus Levybacteria bacterium]|nr:transcription termination factor NusA [Candidatus Levybacteria bacterium]
MAVLQRSEFTLALNQVASERGVDPQVVLDTIKNAILAAYKKDHPVEEEVTEDGEVVEKLTVELDEKTGETRIMEEGKDITPPGFGRIAAQTAKQVLLQKIREKEKDAIIGEYTKRVGTVVNGMILRFQGPTIIVDIGKAEAVIPPSQKIPNESYFLNKKMPVYIVEISEERGREIIVSRNHPGLIEGLLRREVPEVAAGSVTVKKVVREPGSRAKVAVYSEQSGIDPVGSCVGQKGVRIQAVIEALDGLEKIDMIQWNNDPARLIMNALSPAKDLTVEVFEEEKLAKVRAPREELPLVIGREGQNVRLASKLSEYNIEVEGFESETQVAAEVQEAQDIQDEEEIPAIESEAIEETTETETPAQPEAKQSDTTKEAN